MTDALDARKTRAESWFQSLRDTICASFEAIEDQASKAAVLNLGRNLATDLRDEGIPVGIYHPGWVRTEMGGGSADISVEESAQGLAARFDALSIETTGCFECWDGRTHPY